MKPRKTFEKRGFAAKQPHMKIVQRKRFSEKVLAVVSKIPAGRVMSYGRVAALAGNPRAYRAVGNILKKNFDPKVPCHRVICSDGKIGAYNRGILKKIELLKKEGAIT